MNYIELIGPPGIGKSTLLNSLVNSRKNGDTWKTYHEAIFEMADSLSWNQLTSNKSRLLYLLYQANVTNYKKLGIANTIIKELAPRFTDAMQRKYEYFIESQLKAINTLSIQISPINKCSFINWHIQAIKKLFVLETFGYSNTVLFAEGPLKNHHGLNYITHEETTPETLPNAVIYCTLGIDKNIERIQKRKALTGSVSTIHNSLNKAQLEELVSYTHEIAKTNLGSIKMLRIPTYEVDLTHHISDSEMTNLQHFISSYSNIKLEHQLQFITA